MRKLSTVLLSCTMAFGLLAAGCSSSDTAAPGQQDASQGKKEQQAKILMYNNIEEPTSLDPPIGFDQRSYDILNNLMEGMTRLGKDQNPEPAMAKEWKVSDDKKKYTFILRDGVKWSNGDPVTAQDFEYAWKRMIDPATASQAAPLTYVIEGAEAFNSGKGKAEGVKIKAVDEKTLEVTLINPASYLPNMLANPAFFPVHKKTAEANKNWAAEGSTFVSNGPFKISEWKHDSEIKTVKNETYWDAANVKLAGVTWKMINDNNTEYQLYQTGDLHATTTVPADLSDQLFAENKVKVEDGAGTYFYRLNVKKEPFDNVNIRKAFMMALDRQKIVDLVNKRKEKPAKGFVSYGFKDPSGGDFRDVSGELIKFNPDEAKKLLEQGMKEKGYTKLPEITLVYNNSGTHPKIAQAMQEMYKEVLGVDIKVTSKEWKVLQDEQKKGQLMMSRSSFLPDFADPINFLDGFQTGNSMNRTGWSNPKYDKLIKDAYNEADDAKRYKLMQEAEKILMDEAPIIPLYYYNLAYLQSDKVDGVVRHAFGYIDFKWADIK
ncbi:peptide ABC transporter substrate-binding protein [Aneurinibacillus sp. REN35]|uniref:peptide ABC transporter substrate-binding protein n=1 Tax=Aneurinibacillus sp. REN35 TaxID=3237286 RepID=UPI00352760BE